MKEERDMIEVKRGMRNTSSRTFQILFETSFFIKRFKEKNYCLFFFT